MSNLLKMLGLIAALNGKTPVPLLVIQQAMRSAAHHANLKGNMSMFPFWHVLSIIHFADQLLPLENSSTSRQGEWIYR